MGNISNYGEVGNHYGAPKREKSEIDPDKMGLDAGLKNGLSMAVTGAQENGVLGAVGGLAAGAVMGLLAKGKARRMMYKENKTAMDSYENLNTQYRESIGRNQDMLAAAGNGEYFKNSYESMEEGGKISLEMTMERVKREIQRRKTERVFRSGGSVNVIPKGVTHSQKNKIGDNGIPIVSANKKKLAEIEVNELTLNSGLSKKVEGMITEYKKTGDEDLLKELGKIMKSEIVDNTVDLQGELL
jgi:hypothetical protein